MWVSVDECDVWRNSEGAWHVAQPSMSNNAIENEAKNDIEMTASAPGCTPSAPPQQPCAGGACDGLNQCRGPWDGVVRVVWGGGGGPTLLIGMHHACIMRCC